MATACAVLALVSMPAGAATTHTVTDSGDDGSPGQLRTLITAAAPGDTIVIPAGTIILQGASAENENLSGDLDINKDLTIRGSGAGVTIVDANEVDRAFHILPSGAKVVIEDLSIRDGRLVAEYAQGGGVLNKAELTLRRCEIAENSAAVGGGVHSEGELTVESCLIRDNVGSTAGGGLYVAGVANMVNCTLDGNQGNAINVAGPGALTTINCTITGTTAGSALLSISDLRVRNTVFANNVHGNCAGLLEGVSDGYNLSDDDTCGFVGPGDRNKTDAMLGPLADNGGPTWTRAPLPGSRLIDGGTDAFCPASDQRGLFRPVDGDGNGFDRCDIGAYEQQFADCNADGWPDEDGPDADGDGTFDACDACPQDANKTAPGQCGCGIPDSDADGDGVADCLDNCPAVANPDQADRDADGSGDACQVAGPGACGCGALSAALIGLWALCALKQARPGVRCTLRL
ncbi:MAG: right-handed parallel beta-helix repeat-containing protein [Phycisphaerales bacterium]|nr:MAG: right-handed parallel beta-helix repeat-containing protein [Phycisphaerales bacterium]